MTMTPQEQENDRVLTLLAEIKPVLIGWRRGLAVKIIKQCRDGEARKGWQDAAQEIIEHHRAGLRALTGAKP
jgi:hypothetical protein